MVFEGELQICVLDKHRHHFDWLFREMFPTTVTLNRICSDLYSTKIKLKSLIKTAERATKIRNYDKRTFDFNVESRTVGSLL